MVTVMADAVHPQVSTYATEDTELDESKEKPVVAGGFTVFDSWFEHQ